MTDGTPSWHPEARRPPTTLADPGLTRARSRWWPVAPWWERVAIAFGCAAGLVLIWALQTSWNSGLVTYNASSDNPAGLARVTYATTSGNEHSDLALPWSTLVDAPPTAVLIVQPSDGTATVRCSISIGTRVLATNSSAGPGTPAICRFTRKNHLPG